MRNTNFQNRTTPAAPLTPLSGVGLIAAVAVALALAFFWALESSLLIAAALPVLLLVVFLLAWAGPNRVPWLMFALCAAMPFQQALGGENGSLNVSIPDCVALLLALFLPMIFLARRRILTGPAGPGMIVFLGVATVSSIISWSGNDTAVSLARMHVATIFAVLIFANADTRLPTLHRCFTFFLLGINVLSVASLLAFATGGSQSAMYTLGINKNELGPTFGCGIVVALTYLLTTRATGRHRTWLILTLSGATVGILLSLSRGGWVATCVGCLLVLLMTRNFRPFLVSLMVMAMLITLFWRILPKEATDYASNVSLQSSTIQSRFATQDQVMTAYRSSPVYGVGIGLRKKLEPHNVIILTLGETGIAGVIAFVAMFVGGFYTFYLAAKRVRHDPQAWPLVIIGAAVLLVSLTHGMMDVYWRRGVGFLGWSCVGMAASLLARPVYVPNVNAPQRSMIGTPDLL